MNGSESLLKTLVGAGVEVCFINPGTSEMHFVAALDEVDGIRCILGLFENVVTGAADGYARMAGKPAATLLHLGPGLTNGLSNVHNARRGGVPMINIVGDHATYHRDFDAPLTTDIEGLAAPLSDWVHTSQRPEELAEDTARAVAEAGRDKIATLILPADVSWGYNPNGPAPAPLITPASAPSTEVVAQAANALVNGSSTMIVLGATHVTREAGLLLGQLGQATGARVCLETFVPRRERGAGTARLERIPYLAESAVKYLDDVEKLILVGAKAPISFFAYPNVPSQLYPQGCDVLELCEPGDDVEATLSALVQTVGATDVEPVYNEPVLPEAPAGDLTAESLGALFARNLPENAIVVDESSTAGGACAALSEGAPFHDWLSLTGGSLGYGTPAAVGAAVACPGRKVINLQADGSAMYCPQAMWTIARENLDVTIVILNNRKYNILELEFFRTGARGGVPGPKAASTLDIGNPDISFEYMARSMGIRASTATTVEEFEAQFSAAMAQPGPCLIDAIIPPRVFGAR